MDLTLLEQLIGLVERSRVTELVYVAGETRVRIAKRAGPPLPETAAPAGTPSLHSVESPPGAAPPASNLIVTSGMAGTFYRAAAPDEAPFVSEGDLVHEGQTLAILETMKTLNPIECERAGTIARILVANGETVDVGTPLFEIAET